MTEAMKIELSEEIMDKIGFASAAIIKLAETDPGRFVQGFADGRTAYASHPGDSLIRSLEVAQLTDSHDHWMPQRPILEVGYIIGALFEKMGVSDE